MRFFSVPRTVVCADKVMRDKRRIAMSETMKVTV